MKSAIALLASLPLWADVSPQPFSTDLLVCAANSDGSMTLERIPASSGRARWRFECGAPKSVPYWAFSTVKADLRRGRVYIADHRTGMVHCLTLNEGRRIWKASASCMETHPFVAVAANHVLVSGQNSQAAVCLNADTGAIEWRHAPGGEVIGLRDKFFLGSHAGAKALDPATGKELWVSRDSQWPVAIDSRRITLGSWRGPVRCFDAATGSKLWETRRGLLYTAEARGGVIVAPLYYNRVAVGLDAVTGEEKWTLDLSGVDNWAVIARGNLAAIWAQSTGRAHIVDASNGKELRQLDVGRGHLDGSQLIALGENRICYASGERVIALSAVSGRKEWEVEAEGKVTGVAVAGGFVLIVTSKGSRGHSLATGALVWRSETKSDQGVYFLPLGRLR